MRCWLLVCLGLAGCGSGGFVPRGDAGAKPDLTLGAPRDGGAPIDFSAGVSDGGGPGSPCMIACDCDPGLGCANQICTSEIMAIYCCSSDTCPSGQQCQDTKGNFGLCGGATVDGSFVIPDASFLPPDDIGIPLGDIGVNICMLVNCQDNTICQMFGCSACKAGFCSL